MPWFWESVIIKYNKILPGVDSWVDSFNLMSQSHISGIELRRANRHAP